MKTFRLREGVHLKAIYWSGDEALTIGQNTPQMPVSIVIQDEAGQAAPVPWARVEFSDGTVRAFNLALAEGVEFLERMEPSDT